jgi:hypothetical protein
MNRARFDRNRFGRSVAMFQDAECNELRWPYEACTGLMEEDEPEKGGLGEEEGDNAGERPDEVSGARGLRADGRRRSEEDEDFEDEFDDDEEEFGEEEDEVDEDFDDDFDDDDDLDEDLDEEGEEEEL